MTHVQYDLPDPALAAYTWVLFDEHAPSAQTPLFHTGPFGGLGPRTGEQLEVPRMLYINGFTYMREDIDVSSPFSRLGAVSSRDEMRTWRAQWLPQVDQVVALLAGFDATSVQPGEWQATLEHHAEEFRRVFIGIHRFAVGHSEVTARSFTNAYVESGLGDESDARALLAGFPNASLDRASLLWDVSRTLRRDTALLDAVEAGTTLPDTGPARTLAAQMDALLASYGETTNSNSQDRPTWREDPGIVYAQAIALSRQPDSQSPRELEKQNIARRRVLEADLRHRADADARVAELLPMLEAAQEYLPNLEDHNYLCDQRMLAASRARYLSIGALLKARGLTQQGDDVFYLYMEELLPALQEGVVPAADELARRREFVAACRQAPPPPLLGKRATEARLTTIKGVGASKGSYQGRARVIDVIEDAALLLPGEVLVCRATTPAWTPLFGVAGAVVTNAGGALSHTAIVAREFGIPAVLGTQNGTSLIPDGALVTVDGIAGVVTIEAAE